MCSVAWRRRCLPTQLNPRLHLPCVTFPHLRRLHPMQHMPPDTFYCLMNLLPTTQLYLMLRPSCTGSFYHAHSRLAPVFLRRCFLSSGPRLSFTLSWPAAALYASCFCYGCPSCLVSEMSFDPPERSLMSTAQWSCPQSKCPQWRGPQRTGHIPQRMRSAKVLPCHAAVLSAWLDLACSSHCKVGRLMCAGSRAGACSSLLPALHTAALLLDELAPLAVAAPPVSSLASLATVPHLGSEEGQGGATVEVRAMSKWCGGQGSEQCKCYQHSTSWQQS